MITVDWSAWKPGDKDSQLIASAPGWLAEGLRNQRISFPGAEDVDLDAVAGIIAHGLGEGSAEATVTKNIVNELGLLKPLANSLAHFGMALAMSQRALGDYRNIQGVKVQWDSASCCDKCNKNDGKIVEAGKPFPTGHQFPPACEYCICCIMPAFDF